MHGGLQTQRLLALFALGLVLLNDPVLGLIQGADDGRGGFLLTYLFCVWGALIAGTAWLLDRRKP